MVDLVGSVLNEAAKRIIALVFEKISNLRLDPGTAEANLSHHLKYVSSWCSQIQHYGMPTAQYTDEATIALDLTLGARRFRPYGLPVEPIYESNLLQDSQHYVLLGDPGSGKTTTIKRIAHCLLFSPPSSENDIFKYPIVINAKEISSLFNLCSFIASTVGFPVEQLYRTKHDGVLHKEIPTIEIEVPSVAEDRSISEAVELRGTSRKSPTKRVPVPHDVVTFIAERPAIETIQIFLNETNCVLLIDGLDECPLDSRLTLEAELTQLSHMLDQAKLLVSCRTGDYTTQIEGFSLVEILPLTKNEMQAITSRWLSGDQTRFMTELESKSYWDLADRPLFLVQLMLIFRMAGYLPDKSIDVYRKMTLLMLEKWDEQRGVRRQTKYSRFLPERKLDFLCELAWQLTYERRVKTFSSELLQSIYRKIAGNHNLPMTEAVGVTQEIESHTGIVVISGYQMYQFSHLTVQEYLAANFLVRQPYVRDFEPAFMTSSAPFALAVALSSDATLWFSNLVLKHMVKFAASVNWNNQIYSFLDRIFLERVEFNRSELLGMAIAGLETTCMLYGKDEKSFQIFERFATRPNCFESIAIGLRNYGLSIESISRSEKFVHLKLLRGRHFELPVPERLYLRREFFERVTEHNRRQGFNISVAGE